MALIDALQRAVPWAANLPLFPKLLVTVVVLSLSGLLLALVWTPKAPDTTESRAAVANVLAGCYKRSLFTRTHAQLSLEAMFASISECRALVESNTPKVVVPEWAQPLANLLGALDGIERLGKRPDSTPLDVKTIDQFKLNALRNIRQLSKMTGLPYTIPDNLTEEVFFSVEDADKPPTVRAGR